MPSGVAWRFIVHPIVKRQAFIHHLECTIIPLSNAQFTGHTKTRDRHFTGLFGAPGEIQGVLHPRLVRAYSHSIVNKPRGPCIGAGFPVTSSINTMKNSMIRDVEESDEDILLNGQTNKIGIECFHCRSQRNYLLESRSIFPRPAPLRRT